MPCVHRVVVCRVRHPAALPCVLVIIPVVFYIVMYSIGSNLNLAQEYGWVISPEAPASTATSDHFWDVWRLFDISGMNDMKVHDSLCSILQLSMQHDSILAANAGKQFGIGAPRSPIWRVLGCRLKSQQNTQGDLREAAAEVLLWPLLKSCSPQWLASVHSCRHCHHLHGQFFVPHLPNLTNQSQDTSFTPIHVSSPLILTPSQMSSHTVDSSPPKSQQ